MPEIVATPGTTNANSYATLEEAARYAQGLAGPAARAWLALEPAAQAQSLITAAIRLDQEGYRGRRRSHDQALKWPRSGAKDEDGWLYPSDEVPQVVKAAQCDLAIGYGDSDPFAGGDLDAYSAVKIGPLSVDLRGGAKPGALPDQVLRSLRHVLVTGGNTVRLVRG
jgi:hypothetical protein